MTPKTASLTDVRDPHGRVIPTTIPTPSSVAPVAERVRQAIAHELHTEAEVNRLAKALTDAPNNDARAAMADPSAPRTEPALKAELEEAQAAYFAAQQTVKSVRREQHAAILEACPAWIDELLGGISDDRDAALALIDQVDQAFRALARREQLITLLQQIQNGDQVWDWQDTVNRVADKQRGKAATSIGNSVAAIGGLPAGLQSRDLMLEALRHHASVVADGLNPEAVRGSILRQNVTAA